MCKKIGLLSDIHAAPEPLLDAISIFLEKNVDVILCAGDIAGYGEQLEKTIEILVHHNIKCVLGNHDHWLFERQYEQQKPEVINYLRTLPAAVHLEIETMRLDMVHASPSGSLIEGIKLLDETGAFIPEQQLYWQERLLDYPADILVVGHTHQVFFQQLGHLLLVNPGSTLFNHSCAILSLPDKQVDFFALSGNSLIKSWNFNLFRETQL